MPSKYLLFLIMMTLGSAPLSANEHVVLLHGLVRSPSSMEKMAQALKEEGYIVHNLAYPSTTTTVETLAAELRPRIMKRTESADKVHFITHSMGGILVREIQKTTPIEKIGRVVMLAPPNQGSEVVDKIGDWWAFHKINGPAGQQLGTGLSDFIAQLGPVDFECGIIAGDRSINWINSMMIPGPDDGKVSLESAKIEGMRDYKVVHATHPMIMKKKAVIQDCLAFLKNGAFSRD